MHFYLGTHIPAWLERLTVPLFISRHSIWEYKRLPRAIGTYALDSGGFTVLSTRGAWDTTEVEWGLFLDRCDQEIGPYDFAAPLDYMCEPWVLSKTGLSLGEHQARTVGSFLTLRSFGYDRVIPVLQGWELDDYLRCAELYAARGVDLVAEPTVGLGSVCRRQAMGEAERIVRRLAADGLRLHGFGFKKTGLRRCGDALASADSMAWSFGGRYPDDVVTGMCGLPLRTPGVHPAKNCANCMPWALKWRRQALKGLEVPA